MTTRTVFDHIPKTAGTSLIAALGLATGETGTLTENGYPHHVALSLAKHKRFLAGHFWFYNGEPLADGWFYASMLRDPVDRFLSQYYYHRGLADEVARGLVKDPAAQAAVRLDLPDFVNESGELRRAFVNFQARHFADRVCDAEGLGDKDLLDAAIAGAGAYGLIGVYSQVQEFLDIYCDEIGARRQRLPVLNVTASRRRADSLNPQLIERLRSLNVADYGLYAWAEQQFAARRPRRFHWLGACFRRWLADTAPQEPVAVAKAGRADFGNKAIEILDVCCTAKDGGVVQAGGEMVVRLACRSTVEEPALTVGIALRDSRGTSVFGTNSHLAGMPIAVEASPGFAIDISLRAPTQAGTYQVTLALHKGETHLQGCYHWQDQAAVFEVREPSLSAESAPGGATFSLLSC